MAEIRDVVNHRAFVGLSLIRHSMKAILLVGGMGTRLRPLTYRIPKPLVPILDKPLILRVIESIPREVDEIIIPIGYKMDTMQEYFDENPPPREITLVEERQPMGTGGAVKNVEGHLDDSFLVINGDSISSLDLDRFVEFHRRKGGVASISLWEVEDPTPFGIVDLDQDDRILRFQEKPKREEAFSKLINAGVYALEQEVLDHIGEGFVSMEREVFPNILDKGMYGLRFDGYWIDCGTRENLLTAYRTLMRGDAESVRSPPGAVSATPPSVVSDSAEIGEGATVGPFAYISEGVVVGPRSRVEGSVLFEGARIGADCHIIDSIVDKDVSVSPGTVVRSQILSNSTPEDP